MYVCPLSDNVVMVSLHVLLVTAVSVLPVGVVVVVVEEVVVTVARMLMGEWVKVVVVTVLGWIFPFFSELGRMVDFRFYCSLVFHCTTEHCCGKMSSV